MYLTRFRINPERRGARKLLISPQAMHAAVLASYPEPPEPTSESRVLWRVDTHGPKSTLYVSGPIKPDLTALKEQAGWPELPNGWDTIDYGGFLDKLTKGQNWVFRLTANPVHYGRTKTGGDTVPLGHITEQHQRQWLLDRSERNGFTVATDTLAVQASRRQQFKRQGKTVTLRVVTYDGILTISDRDAFLRTLCAGLGRARAYGCGLITLAKAT